MKVAVYGRVSSDEQRDAGTIDVQLHAVREYCQERGYEIVEEFLDEAISGAVPLADRPAGSRLLTAAETARNGKGRSFEAVVVYSLDRMGRDALVALLAIKRLRTLRTPAMFVREEFEDTPAGRFQQTIMSAVAELERDMITTRMSGGRLRAVRDGAYLASAPPWGYGIEQEQGGADGDGRRKKKRSLVIDEEQAVWVRKVFEWAIEGHGLKEIADRLQAAGVPVPAARHPKRKPGEFGWSWSTVAKVLKSRRYTGTATYGTSKFGVEKMTCPAIIDEGTFEAAQTGLAKRRFNAARNTKEFYVLRGLLYCGECGALMHGRIKRQPNGSTIHEFECGVRRSRGPAAGHKDITWRVKEADVLAEVQRAVDHIIANPEEAIREMEVTVQRTRTEAEGASARVDELERRLDEFPVQESRITDAYRRGILDGGQLASQLDAIAAERRATEAELREERALEGHGEGMVATLELVQHWLKSGQLKHAHPGIVYDEATDRDVRTIDALTPQEWRERIQKVLSKVVVEPDGSLRLEGPGDVIYCMTSR